MFNYYIVENCVKYIEGARRFIATKKKHTCSVKGDSLILVLVCCVLRSISFTCFFEPFTCADPKSAKRRSSHKCLFALLGFACAKAAHKMLVKSTPQQKRDQNKRDTFATRKLLRH